MRRIRQDVRSPVPRAGVEYGMDTPARVALLTGAAAPKAPRQPQRARIEAGDWRYHSPPLSWPRLILAAVLAIGAHAAFVFVVNPPRKPKAKPVEPPSIELTITMPKVQELEELDPLPPDPSAEPIDLSTLVPMQADVPQTPRPTDFVQRIDYASLIERPDLSAAKIMVIPDNINRAAILAKKFGTIFNLAELDRIPEPIMQPPPQYPYALKREAESAVVRVEFIVDTTGAVVHPVVVESTHPGFNDAAVLGVAKWRFRPGIRGGRRVNTRMLVPIVFKLIDGDTP